VSYALRLKKGQKINSYWIRSRAQEIKEADTAQERKEADNIAIREDNAYFREQEVIQQDDEEEKRQIIKEGKLPKRPAKRRKLASK
jgi:hypothetical protein